MDFLGDDFWNIFGILYQLVGSTVVTDSCQSSEAWFSTAPFLAVMYGIRCLSEEYMNWIFWEMTSGIFPYFALCGSTVDTCMASGYEAFGSFSHDFPREVDFRR